MYRIETQGDWKFGDKYFDTKNDATNFIVEHLIDEAKKSGKEIDSTLFDKLEYSFEIVDGFYDFCDCGCRN